MLQCFSRAGREAPQEHRRETLLSLACHFSHHCKWTLSCLYYDFFVSSTDLWGWVAVGPPEWDLWLRTPGTFLLSHQIRTQFKGWWYQVWAKNVGLLFKHHQCVTKRQCGKICLRWGKAFPLWPTSSPWQIFSNFHKHKYPQEWLQTFASKFRNIHRH